MSEITLEYRVTITFDLKFSTKYDLINSYLEEQKFYTLKSIADHMPSNIYTGIMNAKVDISGENITYEELKSGSTKVVRKVYEAIKDLAKQERINIALYVQASPEKVTKSRSSQE